MSDLTSRVVRELTEADLQGERPPKVSSKAPALKRVTDRHHKLAQAIAQGASNNEAAFSLGMHPTRVSILRSDPQFRALVKHYRQKVEAQFVGLQERLSEISSAAAQELLERLEDTPEKFDVNELVSIVKTGADRTGHGPQSSTNNTTNVHVELGKRLDAARIRLRGGDVEDATVVKDE